MILKIPQDIEIIDLPTSTTWFDANGFLVTLTKPYVKRTLELSLKNLDRLENLTQGTKVYGIVEVSKMSPSQKDIRMAWASRVPHIYHAIAILSSNALGRMISNLYFSVHQNNIPTKNFSSYEEAVKWLKEIKRKNELNADVPSN